MTPSEAQAIPTGPPFGGVQGPVGGSGEPGNKGGQVLFEFIKSQLDAEIARRGQINTRGAALITTSAALSGLMFGLTGYVANTKEIAAEPVTMRLLLAVLAAFAAAALCGIVSSRTVQYRVISTSQLATWIHRDVIWKNSEENVQRLLAKGLMITLVTTRAGNNRKMIWVRVGFCFELLALIAIAAAAGSIVYGAV